MIDTIINECSDICITILCVIVGGLVVNLLDRKVFNKERYKD